MRDVLTTPIVVARGGKSAVQTATSIRQISVLCIVQLDGE